MGFILSIYEKVVNEFQPRSFLNPHASKPVSVFPTSPKLTIIQLRIRPAPPQQLPMAPLLDNIPVPHHQDQVRVHNGRKPVSNDEAGAALHQGFHGAADLHLGAGVHAGGGLV